MERNKEELVKENEELKKENKTLLENLWLCNKSLLESDNELLKYHRMLTNITIFWEGMPREDRPGLYYDLRVLLEG